MGMEKKKELDGLRKEFNETMGKITKLEKDLSGLRLLLYEKKEIHNSLLIALQKQLWLSAGKRICPKCHKVKDSRTLLLLKS